MRWHPYVQPVKRRAMQGLSVLAVLALAGSCASAGNSGAPIPSALEEATPAPTPTVPSPTLPPTPTATQPGTADIWPTSQWDAESNIGAVVKVCGRTGTREEEVDRPGYSTVYFWALLVNVEGVDITDAEYHAPLCFTGTVQPGESGGSPRIIVTERSQIDFDVEEP